MVLHGSEVISVEKGGGVNILLRWSKFLPSFAPLLYYESILDGWFRKVPHVLPAVLWWNGRYVGLGRDIPRPGGGSLSLPTRPPEESAVVRS